MGVIRQRMLTTLVSLATVAVLGACSSNAPASPDRVESTPQESAAPTATEEAVSEPEGEVTVSQVGWVADDYSTVPYGTVSNTTDQVSSVSVNFAAYDAAGTVLGTSSDTTMVRAGQTQFVIGYLDIPAGAVVAKVDGQAAVNSSEVDSSPGSAMTAGQINVSSDEYSSKVTGTIESTYEQSVTDVLATAVCTDAAGTVVAVGFTFVEASVAPGAEAPYEISLTGSAPTACTVNATPSGLSVGS